MKEVIIIILILFFSSCGESNNSVGEKKDIPHQKEEHGNSDTTGCKLLTLKNATISALIAYGNVGEGEKVVDTTIFKSINKLFRIDTGIYESYHYQHVDKFLLFNLIHRNSKESRYILFTTSDSFCVVDTLNIIQRYQPPFFEGKKFSQVFFHDRKSGLYIELSLHEPKFEKNRVFHPGELRKVGQQFFHLKDGKFKLVEIIPED